MAEMNGLRVIANSNSAMLHSLEEPPDPVEWRTVEEYEAAYQDWWDRMNLWRGSRRW